LNREVQLPEHKAVVVTDLDHKGCMSFLGVSNHGRLACARNGQPYVVPITFALHEEHIYGFSLEGQKIDWMRANPKVCLQSDHFDNQGGWTSVIVQGSFEELPDRIGFKIERERAWSLLATHNRWWLPAGMKPVPAPPTDPLFYRIAINEVSGRRAVPEL
jgi:nitroimidazol reductase NimA-like FMN-containing flavoprotein (pyridoxamine 5'-phosphate oxidase superfamily)